MKIVILNDCFFNQAHLSRLRKCGDLEIYDDTSSTESAIERSENADIVIGDQYLVNFDLHYFEQSSSVKMLALNTTAYNKVDIGAADARGVLVANTPGYSQRSVAELAIGLVFSVVRRIPYGERKNREDTSEPDPASPEGKEFIGYNLEGKTLGVVGYGGIGKEVAKIANGIGMNVIAWNRTKRDGITLVTLEELVRISDVVVITLAYADELKHILSKELLLKLKSNAVLINMGEGGFVDTETLYSLLKEKKIKGAAFDLARFEKDDPFLALNNFIKTPHIASYTQESFYENLPNMIVENVEAYIKGNPRNVAK